MEKMVKLNVQTFKDIRVSYLALIVKYIIVQQGQVRVVQMCNYVYFQK